MKIWIYLNGIQQGPYTLDEFRVMDLPASTPVWYEGLPQWLPASEAPLTAALYAVTPAAAEQPLQETDNTPVSVAAVSSPAAVSREDMPPCPSTYMGWSIFATICCCVPAGIVAIIFSAKTTGCYSQGRYDDAVKMSERAQWAIIISIVLGLLSAPLSFLLNF